MTQVRFLLIAVPFLLLFPSHAHGDEDLTAGTLYPLSIAKAQELEALQRVIYNSTTGKFPTCSFTLVADLVNFETAKRRCLEMGSSLSSIHDNRTNEEIRMLLNTAFPQSIPHDEPEDLEHPYMRIYLDGEVDEEHLKVLLNTGGRDKYWGSDHWAWIGLSRLEVMDQADPRGTYHEADWSWAETGENPGKYKAS